MIEYYPVITEEFMNEFNILKYLNDINLRNVFGFIELPKENKN